MTPVLSAVYEELVERAAQPPFAERSQSLRQAFLDRSGRYDPDHPEAGSRDAAGWEDALVRGGLAAELARGFDDAAERDIALALARAHRGIFVFEQLDDAIIALDLWSHAEFVVLPRDDVGRELSRGGLAADSPLCQARLLASPDGCAVLPGTVFHPADARSAIERRAGRGARRHSLDRRRARLPAPHGTHLAHALARQGGLRVPAGSAGLATPRCLERSTSADIDAGLARASPLDTLAACRSGLACCRC